MKETGFYWACESEGDEPEVVHWDGDEITFAGVEITSHVDRLWWIDEEPLKRPENWRRGKTVREYMNEERRKGLRFIRDGLLTKEQLDSENE